MNRNTMLKSAERVYANITAKGKPRLSLVIINDGGTLFRSCNLLGKAQADDILNDPALPGVVGIYDANVRRDDFFEDVEAAMDEYERLDLCLDGTSLYRQGNWWLK